MITLPNGVKVPDGSDLADPQILLGDVARSISDALGGLGTGKRQPHLYAVANQTEKTALASLTTLQDGDRVFVADTGWWELRSGGAWIVWETMQAVAWPFAHTGVSPGNGTGAFSYFLRGDLVHLSGSFRFGSTTSVTTSSGALALPFVHADGTTTPLVLGTCSAQSGGALFWQGVVVGQSGTASGAMRFDVGAASGVLAALSATAPRAWGSGDILSFDIRWRRKL
ncbi:hypothetical protein BKA24_001800 [Microbacterium marinum]|uniref:Uncharacterized protein n=1 Tax=Microbacterium marinum TaxID=421115 RepID=A0A7W7BQQ8_9MICO|nr:hypothetical protein [Microbacterium marinum]MBB4667091.1 hypothetical protein [Microbacterium marinum]